MIGLTAGQRRFLGERVVAVVGDRPLSQLLFPLQRDGSIVRSERKTGVCDVICSCTKQPFDLWMFCQFEYMLTFKAKAFRKIDWEDQGWQGGSVALR